MLNRLISSTMIVQGLHHHSVVVTDLDRAAAFYRDVLGLAEIPIPSTFGPAGIRVRWLAAGTDQQIHLLLRDAPDPDSPRHIALRVADAGAARQHMQAHGIATRETVRIPGADRFFVADPDGNRIELIEWGPEADTA
jgi:glyoxylase I family protein